MFSKGAGTDDAGGNAVSRRMRKAREILPRAPGESDNSSASSSTDWSTTAVGSIQLHFELAYLAVQGIYLLLCGLYADIAAKYPVMYKRTKL